MRPGAFVPRLGLVVVLSSLPLLGTSGNPKKHPGLVDPATAKCASCHEKVLAGKLQHYPAADSCANCHEFGKEAAQQTVRLTEKLPELCVSCHDNLADAAAAKLKSSHAPVYGTGTCLTCHQPHSGPEAHLLKSPARDLCLGCHPAADVDKAHPVPAARSNCMSCHLPHGSSMKGLLAGTTVHRPFADKSCPACHLRGRGPRARKAAFAAKTCYACHSGLEERLRSGAVHTAVRNGLCTECHDPHLSNEKRLLKGKRSDLCLRCHPRVQARTRAAVAHPPVQKGCDGCHDPHQSPNAYQLKSPVPALCLSCHDPKSTGGSLTRKHLGVDLAGLACGACHEPHGSPQKGLLLAVSSHPPFAERSCQKCHQGETTQLVQKDVRALCVTCHPNVDRSAREAKYRHAALDKDCTVCHSPHAAQQERLVKLPSGGACLACHPDKGPGKGEFGHGVIDDFGCEACHEPHGSPNEKLLRTSGAGLCLGCHDPKNLKPAAGSGDVVLLRRFRMDAKRAAGIRTLNLSKDGLRNHPVTGHRVLGRATQRELDDSKASPTFIGELTCLSCHDPHKGRSPKLLARGASSATESCAFCHRK